jgi:hypothetical protein
VRWLLVMGLLVGGCREVFGIHDPALLDGGRVDDVAHDGVIHFDGPPPTNCYGEPITICLPSTPSATFSFGLTISVDTGSSQFCQQFTSAQIADACVIAAASITLTTGTVHVTGPRPLVLVATDTLSLASAATLDLASHVGGDVGAAANPAACRTGIPPLVGNGTSGGGAGGSFGGRGGDGGRGGSSTGGSGGMSATADALPPTVLRGGCPGQAGAGLPGDRGNGGGAALFIANAIEVDGTIDASGGSGTGGTTATGGGGGGGSGGMLMFEASMLTISGTAKVFASGGAGGEGSGPNTSGANGVDATSPTQPATGGTGNTSNAGDGGSGSFASTLAGGLAGNASMTSNGGGGGGGAGFVLVHSTSATILPQVAPPVGQP